MSWMMRMMMMTMWSRSRSSKEQAWQQQREAQRQQQQREHGKGTKWARRTQRTGLCLGMPQWRMRPALEMWIVEASRGVWTRMRTTTSSANGGTDRSADGRES